MDNGVLVEALRARDPGALAALYDTHAESVYRYCRAMLANPDSAQVALRDTLIAAEALVGSLAEPGRFRPWLYALARGECLRRRLPGEPPRADGTPAPPATAPIPDLSTADPATPADSTDAELRAVAQSTVAGLAPDDREVLELTARHHMSAADVAGVLGTGQRYAEGLVEAATDRLRGALTVEILARRSAHGCERVARMLEGHSDDIPQDVRAELIKHAARCETCSPHRVRQVSPAKVFGLLPPVVLPDTLRVRVLSSFIDPELVPYRRFVARRVGPLDASGFPRARVRREGRLAQAVAGAVATVAAVAAIALAFAQFSGDVREQADGASRGLPLSIRPPAGTVSAPSVSTPAGLDSINGRSPLPPASRVPASPDLVEPVVPALPDRPAPVPNPPPRPQPSRSVTQPPPATVPPSSGGPSAEPSATPTSGATGEPSGGPSGEPTSLPSGDPEPSPSRPPGGPPPAHWPGHHSRPPRQGLPPGHEHQHRPRRWPEPGASGAPQPPTQQPPTHQPSAPPSAGHGGGHAGGWGGHVRERRGGAGRQGHGSEGRRERGWGGHTAEGERQRSGRRAAGREHGSDREPGGRTAEGDRREPGGRTGEGGNRRSGGRTREGGSEGRAPEGRNERGFERRHTRSAVGASSGFPGRAGRRSEGGSQPGRRSEGASGSGRESGGGSQPGRVSGGGSRPGRWSEGAPGSGRDRDSRSGREPDGGSQSHRPDGLPAARPPGRVAGARRGVRLPG
ncbi:sigma factor [Microbispora sp. NPDC049125]|uniref:sigma factor n=1 Tax=Microbispora sp. NPDC049125 TaxID=3154929 RepID=UPI003466F1D4